MGGIIGTGRWNRSPFGLLDGLVMSSIVRGRHALKLYMIWRIYSLRCCARMKCIQPQCGLNRIVPSATRSDTQIEFSLEIILTSAKLQLNSDVTLVYAELGPVDAHIGWCRIRSGGHFVSWVTESYGLIAIVHGSSTPNGIFVFG